MKVELKHHRGDDIIEVEPGQHQHLNDPLFRHMLGKKVTACAKEHDLTCPFIVRMRVAEKRWVEYRVGADRPGIKMSQIEAEKAQEQA